MVVSLILNSSIIFLPLLKTVYLIYTSHADDLGHDPTQTELFEWTHTKKKDWGQWVDERPQNANDLFWAELKRLEEERAALILVGALEPPPISEDEVWVRTVGGRK
ncbi:hypothetical protein PIB30_081430 [Stylosanthes scabra]|uniref:Uncharacterized protein n=1 Tax=Stylosanthes scabra TaxID=79078 RepID=A0ABU6VTP8_9FABA|nr:hypothetical protein [Stylosanthes scabra]